MSVLYVVEQGAVVIKRGELIAVTKEEHIITTVSVFALDQIILFGRVQLSAPVRNFLLEKAIDTVFMTRTGRFRGRLSSYSGGNIELRQAQFRYCDTEERLVELAKCFVSGKLTNCRTLLRRHQRRAQNSEVERALVRLRGKIANIERAQTLDEVRGYEGDGSATYFSCLKHLLKQPGFDFQKRTRRPPRDPFNALLSFGYTMLLGTVLTAAQTVGLEPYLGALHSPQRNRPSVGLDLMEEFRPILVDALAIRTVNRRQFVPEEFEYSDAAVDEIEFAEGETPSKSEYPVLLGKLGIKKWIAIYEEQLRTTVEYPRFGCRLSFAQIITEQARLLARHFLGQEGYSSFTVR